MATAICPDCGSQLWFNGDDDDRWTTTGLALTCGGCDAKCVVPLDYKEIQDAEESEMESTCCEDCGELIEYDPIGVRQKIECPRCTAVVVIPPAQESEDEND